MAKRKDLDRTEEQPDPTEQTYTELLRAYEFFNRELFGNQLPSAPSKVLITLRVTGRSYGYYAAERFGDRATRRIDEIALNAQRFHVDDTREILSTLVHEMKHLWQQHFGRPSRRCYHNREWADAMEAAGLMPSNTGAPGGRRTGQQMSHYIIDGGPYDQAYQKLMAEGFAELLADIHRPTDRKKAESKSKWECPQCKQIVRGPPTTEVDCWRCGLPLVCLALQS